MYKIVVSATNNSIFHLQDQTNLLSEWQIHEIHLIPNMLTFLYTLMGSDKNIPSIHKHRQSQSV
jgi:hypothetical protein